MKLKTTPERLDDLIRRAAWLAYEASQVVGLGVLQARQTTEDEFFKAYPPFAAAVAPKSYTDPQRVQGFRHSVDYAFGRMMKYIVEFTPDGTIYVPDRKLTSDYQSWCVRYPTYSDLLFKAASLLPGVELTEIL